MSVHGEVGTWTISRGYGNWNARQGMSHSFIKRMRRLTSAIHSERAKSLNSIIGLPTIPTLVIAALAGFRLAYLITKESGPMFVSGGFGGSEER